MRAVMVSGLFAMIEDNNFCYCLQLDQVFPSYLVLINAGRGIASQNNTNLHWLGRQQTFSYGKIERVENRPGCAENRVPYQKAGLGSFWWMHIFASSHP